MSCEGFLKNNRGINDGQDLPADFMRSLYDRIVNNEIKVGGLLAAPLLQCSTGHAVVDLLQQQVAASGLIVTACQGCGHSRCCCCCHHPQLATVLPTLDQGACCHPPPPLRCSPPLLSCQMKDDLMAGDSSKEAEAAQRGNLLMNALLTIVGQQKQQVGAFSVGEATCAITAVHVTMYAWWLPACCSTCQPPYHPLTRGTPTTHPGVGGAQ